MTDMQVRMIVGGILTLSGSVILAAGIIAHSEVTTLGVLLGIIGLGIIGLNFAKPGESLFSQRRDDPKK